MQQGKGYDKVPELEVIYDCLFSGSTSKVIDSQAKTLATYLLTTAYIGQGECFKADSLLHPYDFVNKDYSPDELMIGKQQSNLLANFRHLFLAKGCLLSYYSGNDIGHKYLEIAKAMFIKSKDTHSIEYFRCLIELFYSYFDDDLVLAKCHLDLAGKLLEETNSFNGNEYSHCEYLIACGYLANLLGDKDRAEDSFVQALEICKRSNFDKNYLLVSSLMGYYSLDLENIQFDELLSQNNLSLTDFQSFDKQVIYEFLLELQHDGDAQSRSYSIGEYDSLFKDNVGKVFSALSAQEAEKWWADNAVKSVLLNNHEAEQNPNNSKIQIEAFNNVLYTKSFLLRRKKLFDKTNIERGSFYYNYSKGEISDIDDITLVSVMRNFVSRYEKDLLLASPELRDSIMNYSPSCNQIQAALASCSEDAAIEFSVISDSINDYFCAFVLGPNNPSSPQLIKLCDYNEFFDMFDDDEETDQSRMARINGIYNNADIYNKLWKPLEDSGLLRGVKNVFYAPVGDINKINLAALSTGGNGKHRLRDKYTFREVMSTIDIVEIKRRPESLEAEPIKYVCAIGAIDYGKEDEDLGVNANPIRAMSSRGDIFKKLEASSFEIKKIADLFKKVEIVDGVSATKKNFKKKVLYYTPDIIHIATHGIFMKNYSDRQMSFLGKRHGYTKRNDEMIYSGLAFANANYAWSGHGVKPGSDSGILTAEEVSHMSLMGCRLVVLSACETGLGTVDPVDGVFGLQRGFKSAGVERIVMSLWSVNDGATALLMENFYNNLNDGMSYHAALKDAQQKMIDNGYSDPYYWAGFVLLE